MEARTRLANVSNIEDIHAYLSNDLKLTGAEAITSTAKKSVMDADRLNYSLKYYPFCRK